MAHNKLKSMDLSKMKNLMSMDIKDLKKAFSKNKIIKSKKKKEANKKVLSFDIGSEKTKIVVGKYYKDKLEIDKLIIASTPESCVADGVINNLPILVNFIEQKLANEKIKIKDIICTNNSTSIINREIVIPEVEEDEIDTVVKFEIQQYLPLNMNDYVIQYNVLGTIEEEGKNKFRTLVLTYPEKMAYNYYKLFTNINLKPVALDVAYNSINKLMNFAEKINDEDYNKEAATAFIDMGANSLCVQIYVNGKLDFTRIIKSGGSNIDVMLSKELFIDIEQAEQEKINKGCIAISPENTIDEVINSVVEDWIDELQRIIQFYRNKKVGNNIEKIYIYGGSSNLLGIENYMANRLNVLVKKIEAINNIKLNDKLKNEKINQHLNAIGAIIRL